MGDIEHFDIRLSSAHAIADHDPAKRTRNSYLSCTGFDGLIDSVEIDPRTKLLFHPHPATTSTRSICRTIRRPTISTINYRRTPCFMFITASSSISTSASTTSRTTTGTGTAWAMTMLGLYET